MPGRDFTNRTTNLVAPGASVLILPYTLGPLPSGSSLFPPGGWDDFSLNDLRRVLLRRSRLRRRAYNTLHYLYVVYNATSF